MAHCDQKRLKSSATKVHSWRKLRSSNQTTLTTWAGPSPQCPSNSRNSSNSQHRARANIPWRIPARTVRSCFKELIWLQLVSLLPALGTASASAILTTKRSLSSNRRKSLVWTQRHHRIPWLGKMLPLLLLSAWHPALFQRIVNNPGATMDQANRRRKYLCHWISQH